MRLITSQVNLWSDTQSERKFKALKINDLALHACLIYSRFGEQRN